jgi:hypothetical protein
MPPPLRLQRLLVILAYSSAILQIEIVSRVRIRPTRTLRPIVDAGHEFTRRRDRKFLSQNPHSRSDTLWEYGLGL